MDTKGSEKVSRSGESRPDLQFNRLKINLKSILLAGYNRLSQKAVLDKLVKVVFVFLLTKNFRLEFFQPFHINVSAS